MKMIRRDAPNPVHSLVFLNSSLSPLPPTGSWPGPRRRQLLLGPHAPQGHGAPSQERPEGLPVLRGRVAGRERAGAVQRGHDAAGREGHDQVSIRQTPAGIWCLYRLQRISLLCINRAMCLLAQIDGVLLFVSILTSH